MKKIAYIVMSCILFASCGEQEVTQFDSVNGRSLIQFESNVSTLEVLIDSQGTIEIPITVSTSSSVARTVNVEVIPVTDPDLTPATTNQYSFNGAVTIPPNSFRGNLVVTGTDADIDTNEVFTLLLQITSANNFNEITIVDQIHTVNIIQVCPISSDYLVGTYVLSSPPSNIWCSTQTTFIGNNVEVEVSIGATSSQRVFQARYAPGSCDGFNGPYDFIIGLSCGQASLLNTVTTNVSCNGVTDIIIVNDPDRPSSYDINDDNQITVNVIDDADASCAAFGAPFTNQSFTLTKL